jgi:hypothetical protein
MLPALIVTSTQDSSGASQMSSVSENLPTPRTPRHYQVEGADSESAQRLHMATLVSLGSGRPPHECPRWPRQSPEGNAFPLRAGVSTLHSNG